MNTPEQIADIYPLSPLQQGLLFHTLYAPTAAQYFEQFTCRLAGALEIGSFDAAWQSIVDRHPILRSAFLTRGVKEPVQAVMRNVSFVVEHHDWRGRTSGEQNQLFDALLATDEAKGFALNRPPLIRVTLVRVGEEDWRLLWSHHHLLLDGWSLPLLLRDLFAAYHARTAGRDAALPPVRPYGDYIAWLERQDRVAATNFWRKTLGDFTEPLGLPGELGAADDRKPSQRIVTTIVRADALQTERLRDLARQSGVSLNTIVQAAWTLVLGRHARTEDVLFGVTVSGRPPGLPGIEQMVGLFINTLPLRLTIDPNQRLVDWLVDIQRRQADIQDYSYSGLTEIQGLSGVPRGQSLFRTLYAFENFPLGAATDELTGTLRVIEPSLTEKTNYPLTLVVVPGQGLDFKLSYDSDRIADWLAVGLLDQVQQVLTTMVTRPDVMVGQIGLVPAQEKRMVQPFVGTGPLVSVQSLAEAFHQVAERFAERIAITDGDRAWTYAELDARALAIASRLQRLGIGPDQMVGLLMERSAELIAGMVGVIRAGAAYVPLDPRYPKDRLSMMIADSGCAAVIVDAPSAGAAGEIACVVVDIGQAMQPSDSGLDAGRMPAANNAAYVIYTSGSTGTPKGVVVTQRNVLRLFSATHAWFGFSPNDTWSFFHSFSFDFSVWETWGALLHGGRVVVVSYHDSRNPDIFYDLIARERVTMLSQTPSAFTQFMAAETRRSEPADLTSLRAVVFGGEALDFGALGPWMERHGDRSPQLVNMYGITETTVHVTYRPLTIADITQARGSLIGRPIPDLHIHLLDRYGHDVPVGVAGEICVAGSGVSNGYLNRPELTSQRFVGDPCAQDPHARMYRSGDMGRFLPDGELQYIGRIDQQVKVRGFRIEIGEIESALSMHPSVARCLVTVHDPGDGKRLVAYLAKRPDVSLPNAPDLRAHLGQTLPDYMVPEVFIELDDFPLTANGKIDRSKLPDPRTHRLPTGRDYVAPEHAEDVALARIWQEVLQVERVGLDDDYFALGGDSIRAIRVLAMTKKAGLSLSLRDIFEHSRLRDLGDVVRAASQKAPVTEADATPKAPFELLYNADRERIPADIEDAFPLAGLQAGMLFHSDDSTVRLYHDVFAFRLRMPHDENAWRTSLQELVSAHPPLRTSIHLTDYVEPLQFVHREMVPHLKMYDFRHLDEKERDARAKELFEQERRSGYDWTVPGMWRMQVVRVMDDVCDLIVAFHHLVLDGWSLATLISELADRYLRRVNHETTPLASAPNHTFRDFVALERNAERDPQRLAYWDQLLTDAPLTRIQRWPGPPSTGHFFANRRVSPTTANRLRNHAAMARLPLRTLLLAIHVRCLSLLASADDVVTGLVSNGRPETADGARALGLFLNTLPLRIKIPRHGSWLDLTRAVQSAELAMLPHRRVPMSTIKRRHGGRDLFLTSFNYVHFHVLNSLLARPDIKLEASSQIETIDIPFAITFASDAGNEDLRMTIATHNEALTNAQAEAIADIYLQCVEALAMDPAARIDELPLPASVMRGEMRGLDPTPVHDLVARRRTSSAIAVEMGDKRWSYERLLHVASNVAQQLVEAGVRSGQTVCLCFERSFEMVVAMQAVLMAGAAYVPLDPDWPTPRMTEILAQLENPPVLTTVTHTQRLPSHTRVFVVSDDVQNASQVNRWYESAPATKPDQPAYVLFTSGSTGTPRGVVVPHGALSNHMAWFRETFPFQADDVILHKTPYTFDASVWEIWAALMSGAKLRLAPPGSHREPAELAAELIHGRVTVLQLVPSVLDALIDEPEFGKATSLRYLYCGGEALRRSTVARAQSLLGLPVINLYGPTEATIQCSWAVVHERDASSTEIAPLGQPIHNVTLSVRDRDLRVVPIGMPGELCVEGPCLALGYWHDPGATLERFVANPLAPNQRILRTGDVVRALPGDILEYLGRHDEQVKIRGMRVEPGEVEARLAALPQVAQAVVAARAGAHGRLRLVAWVELTGSNASLEDVRAALVKVVPDYMMPADWVVVSKWLRLPSGKIDRRSLPMPTVQTEARELPRPGIESKLASIWRDVLAGGVIHANDDFFTLGGDSILSLQMVARARTQNLFFSVRDVFSYPTLRSLAAHIAKSAPSAAVASEPTLSEAAVTPAQYWFFGLQLPNPHHWNHALLLQMRAPTTPARLARAVRAVVKRHEAFGMRFVEKDGQWFQFSGNPPGEPVFEYVNLAKLPSEARENAFRTHAAAVQTKLDFREGHLFRAVQYQLDPAQPPRLLLVCHHLIVDGLSWRVILQDLAVALSADVPPAMPPAGRLTACAHALTVQSNFPDLLDEMPHWQEQLRALPALPIPGPGTLADNVEGTVDVVVRVLDSALTSRILGDDSAALRAAPHELLLAAFVYALAQWMGSDRVGLMLEGHGRDRLTQLRHLEHEVSDTVGWMTALYPVCIALPDGTSEMECLKAVKSAVRGVPSDGSGYGILRHLGEPNALTGLSEPSIGYNYLGRFEGTFANAPFSLLTQVDTGEAVDPAAPRVRLIDLIVKVTDGFIDLALQFCPQLHPRATMENVIRDLVGAVERLLGESNPRAALSAADFPLAPFRSNDELQAILSDAGDIEDILPLTPVQEGMLYHALRDQQSGVYVQQVIAELFGQARMDSLHSAWRDVLLAHPTLRASFVSRNERPVQRIHALVEVPFEVVDLSGLDESNRARALTKLVEDDHRRGFALDRAPLMRITLVRLTEGSSRLIWTHHHLLLDGWSLPIVFRDFLHAYEGRRIASEKQGYANYLRWLGKQDRKADEAYWRDTLQDFPGATIPSGLALAEGASLEPAVERLACSDTLTAGLERKARQYGITQAALLQAAWTLVLGRHCHVEDVVIGVALSGRPHDVPGVTSTVGTFINTLPLRIRIKPAQSIADWLAEIRSKQAEMLDHQASALVDVARWAGLTGGKPLFEAILVHENYPVGNIAGIEHSLSLGRVTSHEHNHYALSLYVMPGRSIELALYYQTPRYDIRLARTLLHAVHRVLEQLADGLASSVGSLGLVDSRQEHTLAEWNRTNTSVDDLVAVQDSILDRARETPDAVAVVAEDVTLTYADLVTRARALAYRLRSAGVGIETPVGICLSRSGSMLVALLAVLGAGGYYVPLDPAFPDERLSIMIQDASPAWVITESALETRVVALGGKPLCVDVQSAGALDFATTDVSQLAYAIFTSGSTGRPKGVMISHAALANVLASFAKTPGLTAADRLVAVTTLSFDIAALELYLPLTRGGTVVLASTETVADPARLTQLIEQTGATVMQATPATWRMLLAAQWKPPHARFRVWCGGEALPADLAVALINCGVELWNVYGPTETTIWSTIHPGTSREEATRIGRPIANTTCHVVDDAFQLATIGSSGELLIGGLGLARGYLGQPALTALRFIPDPFGTNPGARVYRTGDLARHNTNGDLEALGRLDFQVKVRGYRVELGDIEAALVALPGIAQAVVISAPDTQGDARLVAYLVPKSSGQRPDVGVLREQIMQRLPGYMVPSVWHFIDEFPLTANRKIDRKALMAQVVHVERPAPVAARTSVEKALVHIWRGIIGVESIGIEDSFFELGGHSLTAARIHSQITQVFRVNVPLASLLRRPTIAAMAENICASDPEPGRSTKVADAFLRLANMTEEEKAQLRARQAKKRQATRSE